MKDINNEALLKVVTPLCGKCKDERIDYKEVKTIIEAGMPGYCIFVYKYNEAYDIATLLVRWRDTTDIQFATLGCDEYNSDDWHFIVAIKP